MAYKQEMWDEAKKKCRIGDEEIRMAKEMGLNPKSLIKNIPNKMEATANAEKFMKVSRKYISFEELTPTLLREFVEKIVIHESEAP